MKRDIDVQFLCKDCERYNSCEYYHNRKKDSYICKYFHLPNKLDKIRAEIEEHAKINQNVNTDRARALCWCLNVIDKYKMSEETKEDK